MTEGQHTRLLMGRIGAAHGVKGEVRIMPYTGDPLAIAGYGSFATDRPGLTITVTSARLVKTFLVARIKGVSDRTVAEKLNGVGLYLDRSQLPATEDEDDFYHADLIGLEARLEDGTVLGEVIAVPNYGADDLLEVRERASGRTDFYPFTKAVVPQVNLVEKYLVVIPPEEIEAELPDEGDAP